MWLSDLRDWFKDVHMRLPGAERLDFRRVAFLLREIDSYNKFCGEDRAWAGPGEPPKSPTEERNHEMENDPDPTDWHGFPIWLCLK